MKRTELAKEKIKTWFVTGGSSGIGHELSKQLLENGYNVISVSRTIPDFEHENALCLSVDVTKPDEVKAAIEKGIEKFGKIDVVSNNAGISANITAEEEMLEHVKEVIELNFIGTYNVVNAILPHFRKNKNGTIINNSSMNGVLSRAGGTAYCSSKSAIEAFSEVLRIETQKFARCIVLEFGWYANTKLWKGNSKSQHSKYSEYRGLKSQFISEYPCENNLSKAISTIINIAKLDPPPLRVMLGYDSIERAQFKADSIKKDLEFSKKFVSQYSYLKNRKNSFIENVISFRNEKTKNKIRKVITLCGIKIRFNKQEGEYMKKILQEIFSVKNELKNERKYKVIKILGIKIKFRNRDYCPILSNNVLTNKKPIIPIPSKYNTAHYTVAMLKAYGLKYAIGSPGTKNSNLNFILQENNDIKCFSVVDERSASYTANGICQETNEPCVITSTMATASRNFVPGMTEAYYKKNPVIAITGYAYTDTKYSIMPQFVDRSVTQNDIKYVSVELPRIVDEIDKRKCIMLLNVALTTAFRRHLPVHINCPMSYDFDPKKAKNLPKDIWVSDYYSEDFDDLKKELKNKRIAINLGSHLQFSKSELSAIEKFAKVYNAPVWCDCASNYYGINKLLTGKVFCITSIKIRPDIVIDIGNVSAEYYGINALKDTQVWRITNLNEIGYRFNIPASKIFDCRESHFFEVMSNNVEENKCNYYKELYEEQIKNIKVPDLPLCNAYVCSLLAKYIPNNSSCILVF